VSKVRPPEDAGTGACAGPKLLSKYLRSIVYVL